MQEDTRPKIMIVDDERDSVVPLMMLLEKEGYEPLYASDSATALDIIKNATPALILLDVVLGDESGFELFQKIRGQERFEKTPILFLSGRGKGDTVIEGLKLGAHDYIMKPYSPREIAARIELQLQLHEQKQQLADQNEELLQAYSKLKEAQDKAINSEKLAAIGRLSTGIAHEMSTPISFIISNLKMAGEYIGDIYQVLWAYQEVINGCMKSLDGELTVQAESALELRDQIGLDTVMDELTELARECLEGAESLAQIGNNLCEYSREDYEERTPEDFNKLFQKAMTLARNEFEGDVVVDSKLGDVPAIRCSPTRITQVFLTVLVNAAQAIKGSGTISIRNRVDDDSICYTISDDGSGIKEETLPRVFEPFFSTKPPGQGTGLGLSIAQKAVESHGGMISVNSTVGEGTKVSLTFPKEHKGTEPAKHVE